MESMESIGSDIKKEGGVEASYSATPLRCVLSLFDGLVEVHHDLAKITAPSLVLSSRETTSLLRDNGDEIVAKSSGPGRAGVAREFLSRSGPSIMIKRSSETSTVDFLHTFLKS